MNHKCESHEQKTIRLWTWHPWFAWHPVRIHVEGGDDTCVWLELVARRGKVTYSSAPDYRWKYDSIIILNELIKNAKDDDFDDWL
jgi:hypothetical protein